MDSLVCVCSTGSSHSVVGAHFSDLQSDRLPVHKGVMLFCVADIVCCVIMYHSSTDTPEKNYESIVATQLHFSVCVSVLRHV